MTDHREILTVCRDCTAFVVRSGDRANIHILRPGHMPLTVLGADLRDETETKPEDGRFRNANGNPVRDIAESEYAQHFAGMAGDLRNGSRIALDAISTAYAELLTGAALAERVKAESPILDGKHKAGKTLWQNQRRG